MYTSAAATWRVPSSCFAKRSMGWSARRTLQQNSLAVYRPRQPFRPRHIFRADYQRARHGVALSTQASHNSPTLFHNLIPCFKSLASIISLRYSLPAGAAPGSAYPPEIHLNSYCSPHIHSTSKTRNPKMPRVLQHICLLKWKARAFPVPDILLEWSLIFIPTRLSQKGEVAPDLWGKAAFESRRGSLVICPLLNVYHYDPAL